MTSRLCNHLSKSAFAQMERRTACHLAETNVQKRITTKKQWRLLRLLGASMSLCAQQTNSIEADDVPSCFCVILRGVTITICRGIKVTRLFSVPPPHLCLSSIVSPRCSPVTGSMSPGSASQILARKKRRGVSGLYFWISVSFGPSALLGADSHAARVVLQIIEKRRRDRINHSLSELRRLVPSAFEKQVTMRNTKRSMIIR